MRDTIQLSSRLLRATVGLRGGSKRVTSRSPDVETTPVLGFVLTVTADALNSDTINLVSDAMIGQRLSDGFDSSTNRTSVRLRAVVRE